MEINQHYRSCGKMPKADRVGFHFDNSKEPRVDKYVHFSGPIFVCEIHQKYPPEFANLANIWRQSLTCYLK